VSDLTPKDYFEKQDEMTQRNDLHTADVSRRANAFAATAGHSGVTSAGESTGKMAAPTGRARRAARIAAALSIELRDQFGGREETRTQFLTFRGAVLATTLNTHVGCKVTIQNLKNGRIAECHVISVEPVLKGAHQVEVEFTRPQPEFWPVQFPLEETKTMEVKDELSTAPAALHSSASNGNGNEKAQPTAKLEAHDDQIVVLADSLVEGFNPPSTAISRERYSSRTAPLDSVAQFRAANRAAHRRQQQMKVFYTFLSIAAVAGATVGIRSWNRLQAERPHAIVAAEVQSSAPVAQSSTRMTSNQPTAITGDVQKPSPTIASTATASPGVAPSEVAPTKPSPEAQIVPVPVETKPEETQVRVRHSAISRAHKTAEEEEPMALPLRAAEDSTQAKPEVLNSVVSQIPNKSPVLAPEAPKKVMPAKLLHSVPAQYPPMARQIRVEGDVVLDLDIDAAGNVSNARALSGAPLLRAAAIDAVRRWKYQAATVGDKPVPSSQTVKVDFHLR